MSRKARYINNPGGDQVAKWKAALAAHHKTQRRDRWKRKPPPVRAGMVRLPVSGAGSSAPSSAPGPGRGPAPSRSAAAP